MADPTLSADIGDPAAYLPFALRLAEAARRETLPRFRTGLGVFNKAGIWFDPVTDADREAERAQRRLIEAVYPRHGGLGEEFGALRADARLRWVLDPVDGTRAFICGSPTWATLIALEVDARPVLGVIDQPFTDECWTAAGGVGEYRRGAAAAPLRASGETRLEKARIATTDPRRTAYFTAEEAEAFTALAGQCRVARFSMDAYAYGLLAIGHLDLVVESGLQRHDFSALEPVVVASGGVLTDWSGQPPGSDHRGRILAASSPALHAAAIEVLSKRR